MNSVGIPSAQGSWVPTILPLVLIHFPLTHNGAPPSGLPFPPQPADVGGGKLPGARRDSNCVEWGWGQLWNGNQILLPSRAILSSDNGNTGKQVPWTLLDSSGLFCLWYQSTTGWMNHKKMIVIWLMILEVQTSGVHLVVASLAESQGSSRNSVAKTGVCVRVDVLSSSILGSPVNDLIEF